METSQKNDRSHWKLEVMNFEEAEKQTDDYWRAATPTERLNGLEALREQLYGKNQSDRRIQRVLEIVPQTQG
ncbi:MAG: hypothetical protein ACPG6P_08130 [Akkermansiaceae bacterium]